MVCKSYITVTHMQAAPRGALAYMACRFDPHGTGLVGLPQKLPEQSLILVDDLHPIGRHDPALVTGQLQQLCKKFHPAGLVLDLQRPKTAPAAAMCKAIVACTQLPVAVTAPYAQNLNCPVFLTAPLGKKLSQLLTPWKGREIWLDIPLGQLTQGTPSDQSCAAISCWQWDRFLCCGYAKTGENTYTLCRNKALLPKILEEAARLGIPKALVLYSEWQ